MPCFSESNDNFGVPARWHTSFVDTHVTLQRHVSHAERAIGIPTCLETTPKRQCLSCGEDLSLSGGMLQRTIEAGDVGIRRILFT